MVNEIAYEELVLKPSFFCRNAMRKITTFSYFLSFPWGLKVSEGLHYKLDF